ncbi:hypothetical protein TNCV_3519021 [Trichonephila clavipes]|uniref:Uncharacterized protein n=1 Tax=Trichonephila clavipes TaxID=2585209 RepID=A0A8X6SXZ3_TRICX|nr:hypothetical protein TNCV_3519021 [Trichonephila clavipes]
MTDTLLWENYTLVRSATIQLALSEIETLHHYYSIYPSLSRCSSLEKISSLSHSSRIFSIPDPAATQSLTQISPSYRRSPKASAVPAVSLARLDEDSGQLQNPLGVPPSCPQRFLICGGQGSALDTLFLGPNHPWFLRSRILSRLRLSMSPYLVNLMEGL